MYISLFPFSLHRNRAEYILVISIITYIAFMVFSSLHFDHDTNFDQLNASERRKLLPRPAPVTKKTKRN